MSAALDLRPRGAIGIVDAALRVASRTTGVWALTLPGGAVFVAALIVFTQAVRLRHHVALAALALTMAWCVRGVFQGAACHWVERAALESAGTSTWPSLRAALGHVPSLIVASALDLIVDLLCLLFTLGIGLLFFTSHSVAFAVATRSGGRLFSLYPACTRALGPSKPAAIGVRAALGLQVLLALNLHIAANAGLAIGRQLLALDLAYADRYASLDNAAWVVTLFGVAFALMEPLRAASAALLLIDARVRTEGLDLLAAIERLPRRRRATVGIVAAALLALALPGRAHADPAALTERLRTVGQACGEEADDLSAALKPLRTLPADQQPALRRFVDSVERLAEDDCEAALARMDSGLALMMGQPASAGARAATARARAILSRPEFENASPDPVVEKPPEEDKPSALSQWLSKWLERFWKWIFESKHEEAAEPIAPVLSQTGQATANVLVVVMIAAVVMVLAFVAHRTWTQGRGPRMPAAGGASPLEAEPDTENALSRPPEAWAALADELAARGQFREAIRGLYLALLSRLHRDGAIDYDPSLSNWDYLRRFRGRSEHAPALREATVRFDLAWYGRLGLSGDAYATFRTAVAPMLAEPVGA